VSFDALGQLNWLAVIVGALIYFALGGILIIAVVVSVWQ
jgi:hypothetical protein